jgi:acyl-coenzyme A thioesterase PaaI-like protein
MSSELQARDPQFEERVRASFAQQGLMSTFGPELDRVEQGLVEIIVPFAAGLTQQDAFFHAGVVIATMVRLHRLHSDAAGCSRPDR